MAEIKYIKEKYKSKAVYKCPACGSDKFEVVQIKRVTYPLKGTIFYDFVSKRVKGTKPFKYDEIAVFDKDKERDYEVDEDQEKVYCEGCGKQVDEKLTYDVEVY
jgi:hypothetical protein